MSASRQITIDSALSQARNACQLRQSLRHAKLYNVTMELEMVRNRSIELGHQLYC